MRGSGDIDPAGILRKIGDELLAGCARRRVAGIKSDSAVRRERRAYGRQSRGLARQISIVENCRAELDRAGRSVPDDRDRGQAGQIVCGKDRGDLLQPIARSIEHERLLSGREASEKVRNVRNVGIDEDDLLLRDEIRVVARHLLTPATLQSDRRSDPPTTSLDVSCIAELTAPQEQIVLP
jgi:hypothetical protein